MTEKLPRALTPRMVADLWHCSERHVRNLIASGELPSFRLGGKLLRVRGEDVEAFECQNGELHDCEISSHSPSATAVSGVDTHSAQVTRLRLSALRQSYTQN